MDKNIALISPVKNGYSETFITAHKKYLKGNIKFYYGNYLPDHLEGSGLLHNNGIFQKFKAKLNQNFAQALSPIEEQLRKSFVKENIDIVLAEYGLTGVKVLQVCKQLGIPMVVHFHGFDASKKETIQRFGKQYKEMFQYASAIIIVSEVMKQKLMELGAPEEKLVKNIYGPDDSFFNLQPSFKNNKFVCLGRFVDKKAPYYVILAFKKVIKKFPEAKLVFGGDGPLFQACENISKYYNLDHCIEFKGVVDREHFQNELTTALAYVQHSILAYDGDMEGTPVAILEACAAGLPVISTNHAGIPEVVINNETGYIVEEHDVDGMAAKMIELAEKKELAKQMGDRGRQRISEMFSMNKHIARLDEVLGNSI